MNTDPDFSADYRNFVFQQGDERETRVSAAALFQEIQTFGRNGDFFFGRLLWWLRRVGDWLVGGPSFRRKRRDPETLRVGDVADSWRVVAVIDNERLTFTMDMKAPGEGALEYTIVDHGDRRTVGVRAYFEPDGPLGKLYWLVLVPFHGYLFRGTTRRIVERAAERADQAPVIPA